MTTRALALVLTLLSGDGLLAATFTVDNLNDLNDASPGDGVCDVGGGTCSFRAAAQEANALAGFDTLNLVAGTHVISQLDSNSNGIPVPIQTPMDIIGAGVGSTKILGSQDGYRQLISVYFTVAGVATFANLTVDVQTGGEAIFYGAGCASCGMTLEDVDVLAVNNAPGTLGVVDALSIGSEGTHTFRRTSITNSRTGAGGNGWAAVRFNGSGSLLVEDSVIDGGNVADLGFSTSGGGEITLRRSTVSNLANLNTISAAVVLTNSSSSNNHLVNIEDSNFVSVPRVLRIRNRGYSEQFSVSGSVMSNIAAQAFSLSGPASGDIVNSTISGAGTGVALVAPDSGSGTVDAVLNNVTITGAGTSISVATGTGTITAGNSIIANGTTECSGTLTSAGYNLVEGSCTISGDTTGNITGQDPQLDTLADNGGPTQTHALLSGSPAIDAGDDATCESVDQRAFSRPADGDGNASEICDMGAFEKDAVLVTSEPPVAQDDAASTDEDVAVTIDVAANDTDADGDLDASSTNTSCSTCTTPSNGTLTSNTDGTFDYTPDLDFNGSDGFTYEICDLESQCATANVSITVAAVNDDPIAQDDTLSDIDEDSGTRAIVGDDLLANDEPGPTDEAGQTLTISSVSNSVGGTVSLDAGTVNFNPAPDFFGTASFDYVVTDDGTPSASATATVTFSVLAVNDPPIAGNDTLANIAEDSDPISIADSELLANDAPGPANEAGQALTLTAVANPFGGTVSLAGGTITFTPTPDFFGAAGFDYTIEDDAASPVSDQGSVTFTIDPVNDAPLFVPGPAPVFDAGTSGEQTLAGWVSAIDLGPNESSQQVLEYIVTTLNDNANVLTSVPMVSDAGDLVLTLSGNSGTAEIGIKLRDDGGTANGGVDTSAERSVFVAVGTASDVQVEIDQCTTTNPPNEPYRFAVTVGNAGPNAALDVMLGIPLESGLTLISVDSTDCVDNGTSVDCHLPSLDASVVQTFTVVVQVPDTGETTIPLSANASAATSELAPSDNEATATLLVVPGQIFSGRFQSCGGTL